MRFLHCLVFLVLLGLLCADKLDLHSFAAPFDEVDNSGTRIVSKNWRTGGVANVNQNFVRLTPDRQSKKGALWSRKALGVPAFSTVLKFRISGVGKNFFGDGIALWITQQGYFIEGDLHGSAEKFKGVGIIVDTFKNTERLAQHKDVTILVNDGSKNTEQMTENVVGCDGSLRYHSERADFSVTDSSKIKVIVDGTKLRVSVDERNSGEWRECAAIDLPFENDWTQRAHLAVTASTGQLADNHDVLSLSSYSTLQRMEADEKAEGNEIKFPAGDSLDVRTRFGRVEESINDIMKSMDVLDHHIEHELESVKDHITNMLAKLESREDTTEQRVDNIADLIDEQVNGNIEKRLIALENILKGDMNKRIHHLQKSFDTKLSSSIEDSMQGIGGDWKIPFLILVLVVIGFMGGLYMWYQQMRKKHIL